MPVPAPSAPLPSRARRASQPPRLAIQAALARMALEVEAAQPAGGGRDGGEARRAALDGAADGGGALAAAAETREGCGPGGAAATQRRACAGARGMRFAMVTAAPPAPAARRSRGGRGALRVRAGNGPARDRRRRRARARASRGGGGGAAAARVGGGGRALPRAATARSTEYRRRQWPAARAGSRARARYSARRCCIRGGCVARF